MSERGQPAERGGGVAQRNRSVSFSSKYLQSPLIHRDNKHAASEEERHLSGAEVSSMLPVKETQAVCVWGGGGWLPVKSDCKAENPDSDDATLYSDSVSLPGKWRQCCFPVPTSTLTATLWQHCAGTLCCTAQHHDTGIGSSPTVHKGSKLFGRGCSAGL